MVVGGGGGLFPLVHPRCSAESLLVMWGVNKVKYSFYRHVRTDQTQSRKPNETLHKETCGANMMCPQFLL